MGAGADGIREMNDAIRGSLLSIVAMLLLLLSQILAPDPVLTVDGVEVLSLAAIAVIAAATYRIWREVDG